MTRSGKRGWMVAAAVLTGVPALAAAQVPPPGGQDQPGRGDHGHHGDHGWTAPDRGGRDLAAPLPASRDRAPGWAGSADRAGQGQERARFGRDDRPDPRFGPIVHGGQAGYAGRPGAGRDDHGRDHDRPDRDHAGAGRDHGRPGDGRDDRGRDHDRFDRDRGDGGGWDHGWPGGGRDDRGRDHDRFDRDHGGGTGWDRGRPGWGGARPGGWRDDRRYDWRGWRDQHRALFHGPRYLAPRGYRYRVFSPGLRIEPFFYGRSYWIEDPYSYRLPPADGPYRWIRYYDDVLLIDLRSGLVVDAIRDFFW